MKSLVVLSFLFLLSSCGMNFLFLHPFELNEHSEFKQFKEESSDTLKLTFDEDAQPNFKFLGAAEYGVVARHVSARCNETASSTPRDDLS